MVPPKVIENLLQTCYKGNFEKLEIVVKASINVYLYHIYLFIYLSYLQANACTCSLFQNYWHHVLVDILFDAVLWRIYRI